MATRPLTARQGMRVSGFPQSGLMAGLGDSKIARNTYTVSTDVTMSAQGMLTWASVLCGQRLRTDPTLFYGYSGEKLSEILARADTAMTDMVSKGVTVVVLQPGTNDLAPASGAVTSLADMQTTALALVQKAWQYGLYPIYLTLGPRAVWSNLDSTAQAVARRKRNAFNRWLKGTLGRMRGITIVDPNPYLTDVANNDDPVGGSDGSLLDLTVDGLHESVRGAYWEGLALSDAIKKLMPIDPVRELSAVGFDATDNPYGNMFPNPHFLGTSGTVDTGGSGNMPTNWQLSRPTGSDGSCALSILDTVIGGATRRTLQLTITGGTGATEWTVQPSATFGSIAKSGKWATGDKLICDWPIEVDASSEGIEWISARMVEQNATPTTIQGVFGMANQLVNSAYQPYPDQAWTGVVTTPQMVSMAAAASAHRPRIGIRMKASKNAVVRLYAPSFRRVA